LGFLLALQLLGIRSIILKSQTTHAAVFGTVTDSADAVVPQVTIRVKNVDTGGTQSTLTDDAGRFRLPSLSIGNYEVEAAMPGFKTIVRRPVTLGVSGSVIVDFSLEVGLSEETIFVEAVTPLVEMQSPALSPISTFNERQLQNLPLNGRNVTELIAMNPGVAMAPMASAAMKSGGMGISMIPLIYVSGESHSVNGARAEGQAFLLDNTDVRGFWNRGTGSGAVGSSLGVEAVAGLQLLTNSYGAQLGGNGAVVNAVTKSGTNSFHGSVYEFLRNSALNARNFFDVTPDPPPSRRNQFGASLGGPIKKEKLFFFFNYEGLRQSQNQTGVAFVPDTDVRRGILPGLSTPVPIHSSIKPILDLYPLPNGRNLGGGIGEYRTSADSVAHENYFLGRVDWAISARDSLFARYVSDRADFIQPFAGSPIPSWPEQDETANQYFTLEVKRFVSSSLVNALRFSFVRPVETGRTSATHGALQFLPGLGREDAFVDFGGGSTIGSSLTLPFSMVQNRLTYADDATWIRGAHTLQFGASIERIQSNTNIAFWSAGWYSFLNLDQFLRGIPFRFIGVAPGNGNGTRDFREIAVTPYFNDEWKVTPHLTLNAGLRYDYGSNPSGVRHPLYAIVDPPNGTGFEQVSHVFRSSPNTKNWDPRFGFAWDPLKDRRTSVRGGFGIFHIRVAPRTYVQAFTASPPFFRHVLSPPPFPNPFPASPARPAVTVNDGLHYNLTGAPYQMEWSLSLQREILNSVLMVGYAGSRGIHLLVPRDLNPPNRVVGPDGLDRYGTLAPSGAVTPNPRINPALGRINTLVADGNSIYNSLQTSFDRRVTRNLNAMLSYTWSKCIDNGSGSFLIEETVPTAFTNLALSNPYDARADRGLCAFDRRHSFRGATMIAMPFAGNRLVEGWMISAIVMANSGRPFSVTDGFDQAGFANNVLTRSRPDAVAGCKPILGKADRWYDPACFRLQPAGRPGNLGRNTLTGPSLFTADVALIKNVRLREPATLQFRTEVFNVFNHPNLGLPNLDLFVPDGTGGATVSPAAGRITDTTTPGRQIQFGVKILF
jgi:hypothetical protein